MRSKENIARAFIQPNKGDLKFFGEQSYMIYFCDKAIPGKENFYGIYSKLNIHKIVNHGFFIDDRSDKVSGL